MDIKQHILERKSLFDEEIRLYKGSDPLNLRYEFMKALEGYDKEMVWEMYTSVLEDTLRSFMEEPRYKQDVRFIQLWLRYSATQPNPTDIFKNMYNRGLGTECAMLYSSWAEQLVKNGLFIEAGKIFKMGLSGEVFPKNDLIRAYEEFLQEVGKKVLLGEITCPSCGNHLVGSKGNSEIATKTSTDDVVQVWEWNPLKVGEKDDFTCPIAYFEEPDSTKKRMYPKDKVYPGSGQEFCLEEILAETYEKRCEEERQKMLLAEMKSKEYEARRATEEMRKAEAEKMKFETMMDLNPPVQAAIPVITPKMLNLPKDMDNSLVNGSTFTVHTKEALNVVQDMWSSPTPTEVRPKHLFQNNEENEDIPTKLQSQFKIYSGVEENQPMPRNPPFKIYDENSENIVQTNCHPFKENRPFEIYDENEPPVKQPASQTSKQHSSALKPKVPLVIYDENAKSHETPVNHLKLDNQSNQGALRKNVDVPDERNGRLRYRLFSEDGREELAEKMESQAKLQTMYPVHQDKNDFNDVTCNTKAFEFVLPSSTPFANHKKPSLGLPKLNSEAEENLVKKSHHDTNLSVILEQSKERSSSSSSNSSSKTPKTPKAGPVISAVTEDFDPFNSEVLEDCLNKVGFPKQQYAASLFVKSTNVPNFTKVIKLGSESYSIQGEIGKGAYARIMKATKEGGNQIFALKVEKPPCKWEFYIAKEIQNRIPPKLANMFIDIPEAHVYNNGTILVMKWAKLGTLLGVVNTFKEKAGKSLEPGVIFHFGIELIDIVDYLHRAKIIHADLKPDNIILRALPEHNEAHPCLQLIDFGRCIDMSLLPPGTQFNCVFKTEENKCNEMKENKPWSYQLDLYGLAMTFHCLLLAEYLKVVKRNDKWMLQKQIPRNMRREVWNPIFDALLNVDPLGELPINFSAMRTSLIEAFDSSINTSIQSLLNLKSCLKDK